MVKVIEIVEAILILVTPFWKQGLNPFGCVISGFFLFFLCLTREVCGGGIMVLFGIYISLVIVGTVYTFLIKVKAE